MNRFDRLTSKAKQTNAERDKIERKHGNAAPGDSSLWVHIRTAMFAIEAGITHKDWDCVTEGYVMLQEIDARIKQLERNAKAGDVP